MKVAIIGAGIAGLACAIELEKRGIRPQIFEKKHRIGSPFSYSPLLLDFIFRPIKKPLDVLKKKYGIDLKTVSEIHSMRVQGPSSAFTIGGHLGYSLLRGQEIYSIESQMANQLKSPIQFTSPVKPEDLIKQYNYVVVATGDGEYAKNLETWQSTYNSWIRGATILGHFNPEEIRFWFNREYTKSGYAYMAPMGPERATLLLNVSNTSQDELPTFWQNFLDQEQLNPEIMLLWDIPYNTSFVYPQRVGNTLFVGNSGGFVTSWLGQGIFSSIISGVEAARSIALNHNFQRQMKEISKIIERQARFRRFWNKFDNKGLDRAIRLIGNPLMKISLYQTNLDPLKAVDLYMQYIDKKNI
ncbi:NAD(P)/FAD-dependent oxidoreductase [Desulfotomaculum defluvii]